LLPGADTDRHVFLMGKGAKPLNVKALNMRLKVQVYRHTKKRLYTHLLRTIFTSNLLSANADINTVAYLLNDDPRTVLARYNELQGVQHQQSFREAYARALHGNGHGTSHGPMERPERSARST
jgi:site-specific recombinase XerD